MAPEPHLTPLEIMERLSVTWFPEAMTHRDTPVTWGQFFDDHIVLVEPATLPHGGRHEGRAAFDEVQRAMQARWEQRIVEADYWLCAEDRVALRIVIRWRAHATGLSIVMPMIDLMTFRDGRIVEIEVFLQDTAALLGTLEPRDP